MRAYRRADLLVSLDMVVLSHQSAGGAVGSWVGTPRRPVGRADCPSITRLRPLGGLVAARVPGMDAAGPGERLGDGRRERGAKADPRHDLARHLSAPRIQGPLRAQQGDSGAERSEAQAVAVGIDVRIPSPRECSSRFAVRLQRLTAGRGEALSAEAAEHAERSRRARQPLADRRVHLSPEESEAKERATIGGTAVSTGCTGHRDPPTILLGVTGKPRSRRSMAYAPGTSTVQMAIDPGRDASCYPAVPS